MLRWAVSGRGWYECKEKEHGVAIIYLTTTAGIVPLLVTKPNTYVDT